MLTQLIEHLDKMVSVQDKFREVEEAVLKKPTCKEDVIYLIRMSRYQLDAEQFPKLKQNEVYAAFNDCKQVLTKSDADFYI
jgi:hypothetical protein